MFENSLTNNEPPIEVQPDETGPTPAQRIGKKLRNKRRPRLPDVPDDTPVVAPAPPAEGAEQRLAPAADAKAQMQISPDINVVSAGEIAPIGDEETEEECDPRKQRSRGGRKRLLLAAGAVGFVALFFALMAFAVWFAFYRSAGEGAQSSAGRLGLTRAGGVSGGAADPTAPPEMPVSADEIRKKTGAAAAVGASAPAAAGDVSPLPGASAANAAAGGEQQQQMPSAYAQMDGAPISERLPYDSLSTTITASPQPQQSAPTHSGSELSADSSTDISSRTRGSSSGDGKRASDSTFPSGNEEFHHAGGDLRDVRGTPHQEHSMRAFAIRSVDTQAPGLASDFERSAARAAEPGGSGRDEATGVVIPPLGTLLPVRTLGAIYTLRSGALIRLHLTRDVGGAGWSLRRGTELYGTLRGSDYDIGRAYVSLIGFVDSRTNRLVRMSGDVLGSDGAEGLPGTRRSVDSRWAGAARKAGVAVLDVLGSAAASFGGRPVVIGDLYGESARRAVSPVTQEMNRTASGRPANGFVEVPAGRPGQVLVMTLPAEEQGGPADPDGLPAAYTGGGRRDQFAHDADALPPVAAATTRIPDNELADLLRFGSPTQIRHAWPLMSPEMRRVASRYLEEGNE